MNEMGENSPVLIYKPQGGHFANLQHNDFCLVLMTSAQKEMLLKFGNEKICIDSTHGTNPYDFQLTTILVIDDFGAGFPVGFCVSNTTNTRQMEIFFKAIVEKTRTFTPEVFMSDDASAYFNAWRTIMGEPKKQLLCTWHVVKNWKQALLKIKNQQKRDEVYKFLRLLLEELDSEKFYKLLERFVNDLKSDEDTKDFHKYFTVHYANRCHLWAYCHRKNCGINTNMYLEAFHKVLKYKYMGGRKCQRLDTCISLLLKVVRDLTFARFQKLVNGANCGKIADINSRHRQSLNIRSETISESDPNEWKVQSEENKNLKYVVRKEESLCEGCNLICSYCKICIHSYICSCIDSQTKLNMCKHIHAVYRYTSSNEEVLPKVSEKEVIAQIQESDSFQNFVEANKQSTDSIMKLKVSQMTHLLDNNNLNNETKQKIMKHIDAIIELASNKNSIEHNTEKEPANKKIEVQQRFFSTKRKRPVIQNSIKNPSTNYKIAIKESIENDNDILNVHDSFDHTY